MSRKIPRRFTMRSMNHIFYENGRAYVLLPEWAEKRLRVDRLSNKLSQKTVKYCKRLIWQRVPELDAK